MTIGPAEPSHAYRTAVGGVVAYAKGHRLGDVLRRGPGWHGAATSLFDRLERAPLAERRAWTDDRLSRVLIAALRTDYGRRSGGARSIEGWPVLEKEAVRAAPGSFVRGSRRMGAPAATSGTTGVPLDVWRSFRSVAVEQAAIDLLLARMGVRLRASRVAVLRGDDIKDPGDREPPFWVSVAGGQRLVFSSNHLSAETVSAFAAALTDFEPHVLYAYPTDPGFALQSASEFRSECLDSDLSLLLRNGVGRPLAARHPMCSDLASSTTTGWPSACRSRTRFRLVRIGFFPAIPYNELIPCGLGSRR